jgi:hypothetical protein
VAFKDSDLQARQDSALNPIGSVGFSPLDTIYEKDMVTTPKEETTHAAELGVHPLPYHRTSTPRPQNAVSDGSQPRIHADSRGSIDIDQL